MAEWAGHNLLLHRARSAEKQAMRLATDHARKARDRERFIDHLTRKHAERLGIPLAAARERVLAVAVSARKREDAEAGA
jgi:hypothetical protein